ncbi:uncharacterized protein CBL_12149 [Carabus blaptoides fortunei]
MDEVLEVPFNITDAELKENIQVTLMVEDSTIADFDGVAELLLNVSMTKGKLGGSFPLRGVFLGHTKIFAATGDTELFEPVDIIVVRRKRAVDTVFTASVAILVALIYVNFGCALKWDSLRDLLKRPVGPVIGFFGQFVVMPLLGYGFGQLIFPDRADMQLGLLFVGVSPAGGASNVWTVVLDGNINLSVAMTTISTLAAFGMMPLWLFTVGPSIFAQARIGVPYEHIASLAAALVLPLFIGWLIQRFLPRVSALMTRILKGFSALLILFIVIFAIATNLYLFQLFSWRIAVAGIVLPWCGYALGYLLAVVFKQPPRDALAIAIETGVQNTGIAIFLLRFALPQPQADLTTVVPVAIAIMTPVPLAAMYVYKRFCRSTASKADGENELVNE